MWEVLQAETREDRSLVKKVPFLLEKAVGVLMYLGGQGRMGADEYPRMFVPSIKITLHSNSSNRRPFRAIIIMVTK